MHKDYKRLTIIRTWDNNNIVFNNIIIINHIIYIGRVPDDWHLSYIINIFRGKRDALSGRNYKGLKFHGHLMKILQHIVNTIIRSINNMQFGFIPGRGTTDTNFMFKQASRKVLAKEEKRLLSICQPRKGFRSCTSYNSLVGNVKT